MKMITQASWILFLLLVPACRSTPYEMVWHWPLENRSYAEPMVDGKTVYVVSQTGQLIAGNYETGKQTWAQKADGAIVAAPAVSERAIFAATQNGNIYAWEKSTGKLIWKKQIADRFISPLTVADDLVLIPSETGVLYALVQLDGRIRWTLAGFRKFNTRALVNRSSIFLGGWSKDFLCLGFDGSIQWKFRAAYPISGDAVVHQNTVYFPAYDGYVYALEIPSGRMRWHSPVRFPTNVIVHNQELIVGSEGRLVILSAHSGQSLRTFNLNKPITWLYGWKSDCLIVSGSVFLLDAKSGKITPFLDSQRPIFRVAITPEVLIATDEFSSVSGFAE